MKNKATFFPSKDIITTFRIKNNGLICISLFFLSNLPNITIYQSINNGGIVQLFLNVHLIYYNIKDNITFKHNAYEITHRTYWGDLAIVLCGNEPFLRSTASIDGSRTANEQHY